MKRSGRRATISRSRAARESIAWCIVGTAVYHVGSSVIHPFEEPVAHRIPASRSRCAPAVSDATTAADEAMNVEQRHHVQAAIVG